MGNYRTEGRYTFNLGPAVDLDEDIGLIRENRRRYAHTRAFRAQDQLAQMLHNSILADGLLGDIPPEQAGRLLIGVMSKTASVMAMGLEPEAVAEVLVNVHSFAALRLIDQEVGDGNA